jgi:C4-dicarboxylate transporter DctM subunit
MLSTVLAAFFALLIFGMPISLVVLAVASIGIVIFGGVQPIILIQQLFNGLDRFIILAVPFFIMSGAVAAEGDIAKRIVNVMNVFFGRIPGGLGIATVFSCAFFGAITGSSMATVVAIGSVMLPSLIKHGYPKSMATGIITTAGSLGVLIPPSIPMVILCVTMETSIGEQFLAGFLPGLLIAAGWSFYIAIMCKKNNYGQVKKYSLQESLKIIKDSTFAILFPVIVLGGIYGGFTTPTEASAVSLIYVLIVEIFIYKNIKFKDLTKVLGNASVSSAALTLILAAAMVFVWFMTTQQIPAMINGLIGEWLTSQWALIAILLVVFLIMGCFIDVVSVVLILGPMLILTLTAFKIDLIHFGIMAVVMSQVGFITPPFGFCLFVSMQISNQSMGEVVKATLPYMILLLLMNIIIAFIPQISTFLPSLFLR